MFLLTGPTQKSSKYGTGPPQQKKLKYNGPTQKMTELLKTLSFASWVGPVYLVIFSVPYLELFWVGPVKRNTLSYQDYDQLAMSEVFQISPNTWQNIYGVPLHYALI